MTVVAQRNGVRVAAFQKCGHTSIINTFRTPYDRPIQKGVLEGTFKDVLLVPSPECPIPIVTVAYFRHPFARIASVYNHLVAPVNNFRENFLQFDMHAGMPFSLFCERLCDANLYADPHLEPQLVGYNNHTRGSPWLARLERIVEDWPQMVEAFGLDCAVEVPRFNRNENNTAWPTMYENFSAENLNALADLYAPDMDIWESL